MNENVKDIQLPAASELSDQIDANGFAVINDYISEQALRSIQAFVIDAVARNGGNYVML